MADVVCLFLLLLLLVALTPAAHGDNDPFYLVELLLDDDLLRLPIHGEWLLGMRNAAEFALPLSLDCASSQLPVHVAELRPDLVSLPEARWVVIDFRRRSESRADSAGSGSCVARPQSQAPWITGAASFDAYLTYHPSPFCEGMLSWPSGLPLYFCSTHLTRCCVAVLYS